MSIIHPYLLARIYAVQSAFEQAGYRSNPAAAIATTSNGNPKPIPNSTSIWDDLLKDSDDKEGGSGSGGSSGDGGDTSGGTMKGLRGKNHISAMRRLGR